jgi:predicted RNA binding protein YcfA (HicA-like mRNA interferase family)
MMNTFSSFITENKNTHMTHIEDKVLYGGVKGTREAILALRSLRDMLGGSDGNVSVKWDGAPAIFAGIDPRDGRFFVAKKGIFNKSPKVYKSDADVDDDTSGDLADKLKLALKHLPELGIKGVIQGDFLYGPGDVETKKINGKSYITFHPNTIVYAIPAGTEMAKQVSSTKIGIVWHTTYTGKTFEGMKASYGVDVNKLRTSKNVWSQDAMLRDMTKYTMTKKETDEVNDLLKKAGFLFNRIAGSTLRQLENDQQLAQLIETHGNRYVRAGALPPDPKKRVDALIQFINDKYAKEIAKRTTEKGKSAQQKKLDTILTFFGQKNKASLVQMN